MDGQNTQPPPGNRPPPPPPRSPQGMGAPPSPQQPYTAPPQPRPPQAPHGDYSGQQPTYPQQADQQPPPYGYPPQVPDQPAYAQQQPSYPYPPQQDQYYPYPPARTGLPTWVWGAIGAAVIVLIGGGVLLFLLLSPKSSNPPNVIVVPPTTIPGQPTPVIPQGGGDSPRAVANSFWSNVLGHNYDAAFALIAPELRAQTNSAQLKSAWELMEANMPTRITSIVATGENITGDTATVPLVLTIGTGQSGNLTARLRKVDNKWFIVDGGQPTLPTGP